MKRILITTLLLICSVIFVSGQSVNSQKEAERIWELVIQTKGGREKLHSVRNMVEISHSKVQYALFKTYENIRESLYVFSDEKYWSWDDNRPYVFGLQVSMYNYKTLMKYHEVLGSPDNHLGLVPFEANELKDYKPHSNLSGLVGYLLETEFWQPIPQSISVGKKGFKKFITIQTLFKGNRIDFVIDQKTNLPIQTKAYFLDKDTKQERQNTYNYSDYKEFDGIMMPTKLGFEGESGVEKLSFVFNVEYNEDIFTSPPLFEAGPEAWKIKK